MVFKLIFLWSWLSFLMPGGIPNTNQSAKRGMASYYHNRFSGRRTASGEVFNNRNYTAASNHFNIGKYVKVTNLSNGRSVYVKINDRMGYNGRVIDMAQVAAEELKYKAAGKAQVRIEEVSEEEGQRRIAEQDAARRQAGRL